jgi:hypothetical protein
VTFPFRHLCMVGTSYRVSHNTWDYKNALERPLNDNIESWEVSHFEAKDHTFQTFLSFGLNVVKIKFFDIEFHFYFPPSRV